MKRKTFIFMLVLIIAVIPSLGITAQAEGDAHDGSDQEGLDNAQTHPDQNVGLHNEQATLLNGGFEDLEAKPQGWTVVNGHPSRVESSTEHVYRGDYSVKLTDESTTTAADLRSNKVPVTPGETYEASVFSYNVEGESDLYLEFFDAGGNYLDIQTGQNTALNEWKSIEVRGVAPEGATHASVRIYLNAANVGTSYFDDASLVTVTENGESLDLVNGGFEELIANPRHWTVVNGSPADIESSTDHVHSGTHSVKLTDKSDSGSVGLLSNRVPATPGVAYEASVFSYNTEGNSSLYLEFFDANGGRLDIVTGGNETTDEWRKIEVTGTAPKGTASAALRLYLNVANVGTAYYDDASFDVVSLEEIYQKLIDKFYDAQEQLRAVSDNIPPGDAVEDIALRQESEELNHQLESLIEQGDEADDAVTIGNLIIETEHLILQIKRLSNFVDTRKAQPESPFGLVTADAMELVYPKEVPCQCSTDPAELSLAKGEYESIQAVVMPYGETLHNVSAEITSIVGPDGAAVSDTIMRAAVDPLGSVYVSNPHNFILPALADRPENYEGWMPDPIRSDLSSVDVPAGDMQPFWIELYASDEAETGTYRVTVSFFADGKDPGVMEIEANVWPFDIPDQPELPTSMTMNPEILEIVYGITGADEFDHMHQKYTDFLERFKIEQDLIYTQSPPSVEEVLKRQTKWGLRQFTAYYIYPGWLDLDVNDPDTWQPEIDRILEEIETAMAAYAEAGLADKAYVYGFDESRSEHLLLAKEMFGQIKERFPDLPIMTTYIDRSLGTETGLADVVDIWVPGVETINHEARMRAQNRGDQVYWYTHQAVRDPLPNWFNGCAPSDTRVLLGPMSHKMDVDGFLYYNITRWVSEGNNMPMADGILSNWDPLTFPTTNGDGSLFYPGADGPLASQRIHNFRDGMEDYNLLNKLEDYINQAQGVSESLLEEAQELLNAEAVVTSENEYTKDADLYRQWREDVAQMIIALEPPKNVDAMLQRVAYFDDAGAFENDQAAHALKLHLTAVGRYEQLETADKIVKHMEGFKLLLDHQRNNDLISGVAYSALKAGTEVLIKQWQ